jgi:hypothetical protein
METELQAELPAGQILALGHYLSLAALVVVNLLPVAGVLLFDWDVGALMVLYWSENLVLGAYTIFKMLVVAPIGGIFSSLFFLIHFGGFCAVHGLFISTLLLDIEPSFGSGESWPFFLVFVQLLVEVVRGVLSVAPPEWLLAFAALWLSHGISLIQNFFIGGERHRVGINKLMSAPYSRIVILHITIIFGGFAVMAMGEHLAMLLLLVVLKLGVDIVLHRREHRRLAVPADELSP